MSIYTQALLCWGAFILTAALYTPSQQDALFETPQDFVKFKEERKQMWCGMVSQLTNNEKWMRDVPTCSFGGHYPTEPVTEL